MKTKLKAFVVAVLIALSICGCTKKDDGIVTGLDTSEICNNYNERISELEVRLVHAMTVKYQTIQDDLITPPALDEAMSVWFNLETIKKFVYHLENEAGNKDIGPERLGIRFYYTRYPEMVDWGGYDDLMTFQPSSPGYGENHTLIGVPTINREGVDFDFNPVDERTFSVTLNETTIPSTGALDDFYALNSTELMAVLTPIPDATENSTGAQNHGTLIPPGNETPTHFKN